MAEFIVSTLDDETFDGRTLESETADGGGLSLREAIALANDAAGADTISFGAGGQGLLRLTEGRIRITDETTINGGGEVTITGDAGSNDVTLAGGITDIAATLEASANGLADNSQIFNATRSLTLTDLILTGGATDGFLQVGGAVASSVDITLINTVIAGNATLDDFANGGGLYSAGSIMITGGQITGKSTAGTGAFGGGVAALGDVTIINSTLSGNQSTGGASIGGGALAQGILTLTNSTVTNNSVTGGNSDGGGVVGGTGLVIANSIVLGNFAMQGDDGELVETAGDGAPTFTGANIVGADGGTIASEQPHLSGPN